jgi:4-hydroxy-4-methyl-2-oxoglutarate aldolase
VDYAKIARLVEIDTPTVANGLELLNVQDPTTGYTGPDIRALMPDFGPRVGIAVTARMDTTTGGVDNPEDLYGDWIREMYRVSRLGGSTPVPVFAVMESVGPRPRATVTIGDGMGTTMKMAGAVGFITNGSIRDLEGVRAVPLACWAAGLAPMHGRLRWLDIGSPVVIDGMTVRNGDVIHADVNGAVVIPAAVADQVYERALQVRRAEQEMFATFRSPGYTIETYLQQNYPR